MKKILFLLVLLFPINVFAKDITNTSTILIDDSPNKKITDKDENSYIKINKKSSIFITNEEEIYGVYIIYELESKSGTISNSSKSAKIAENNFLHEYINVNKLIGASKELTIKYNDTVKIGEIYILSKGDIPDFVEKWNEPYDKADLLLFSTHSDDEHLFFAGLIPYYVNKGAKVQVVYFTNHNNNPKRLHEQIHGLYTVGIRNYPIIGLIPDAWSDNLDMALKNLKNDGYEENDAIKFEVQMIRRFKPLVIVGHDELGEYSHGQHILNTFVLKKALNLTNDNTYDKESIIKYGLWDTPKIYLHLYNDNKIIMNYDEPLEAFDGKTAYEVSKEGFNKHHSQQFTWFTKWLTGIDKNGKGVPYKKASEIKKYSPCAFGLYKTSVGNDINKNDMFENLKFRSEENNNTADEEIAKDDNMDKNLNKTIYSKTPKRIWFALPIIIIIIIYLSLLIGKNRRK